MSDPTTISLEDDFLFSVALTPEYREDPYPFLADLRSRERVYRSPFGIYLLTHHDDVASVVRDPRLSNNEKNSELYEQLVAARGDTPTLVEEQFSRVMLFLDPPDHTRLRGLVSQAFTPSVVEGMRPTVGHLVIDLLDKVEARGDGTMDVIADLAYPLPVVVICDLLGVPREDHATFQEWSRKVAAAIDPDFLLTDEQRLDIATAGLEFVQYFNELIEQRRRAPGDDLLSALIAVEADGDRLTHEELVITGLFLLIAGHETTVNLIGNGMLALLRHPDQLARLRDDPSLDRNAVEELLRYDSPVQLTQRVTLDELRIGDVTIPARQQVIPLLGAANRDPATFAEPDRLDLGRANARQHVAFGGGAHFCLGAPLARLEGEIALSSLVRRFATLELDGTPVRRPTFTLRGLRELPVRIGPRDSAREHRAP